MSIQPPTTQQPQELQQPVNPTPSTTASVQAVVPEAPIKTTNHDKKNFLLAVAVAVVLMLLAISGYYFLVLRGRSNTNSSNNDPFSVGETERRYESDKHGFSMVVKKEWDVNEIGNKVVLYAENDGTINFEAFSGEEFSSIEKVDDQFCNSFESGFKEGLEDTGVADQFDFKLFEQNGLLGCEAEGQIIPGYIQKYNVFYNPELSQVFSLFYTVPDEADRSGLDKTLASFQLINQ